MTKQVKLLNKEKSANKAINKDVAKEILKEVLESKSKGNDDNKDKKSKSNTSLKGLEDIQAYYYLTEEGVNVTVIIHKILEVLEVYLKTIQQILQPEEFHALYECRGFEDDDKEQLFNDYAKIIVMHRELLKLLIENDEKKSIASVKKIHEESLRYKSKMIKIVDRMQKSWDIDPNKKTKQTQSAHYFG